jgi:hypothetical protein
MDKWARAAPGVEAEYVEEGSVAAGESRSQSRGR